MCWGNRGKVITQSWNLLSSFTSLSQGFPPPWWLPSSIKDSSWRERLCSSISCPKQSLLPTTIHTILLAAKKQPVTNYQYTTGGTTCQEQSWMLTLRTDTRQMQGSRSPVAGLALILHTKVNFFFQRTQFS